MQRTEQAQLRMVWPEANLKGSVPPQTPADYVIRTYQSGDDNSFAALMRLMDFGPWTQEKFDFNVSRILPGGWFFALHSKSEAIVATVMCLHNYCGYYPFAGDVGWLACHPAHRGKRLGYSLSASATNRFREAGYSRIQLHTEYYRLPAIKTYLKLGYLPVVYSAKVDKLWQEACRQLNWPYTPEDWPKQ